MSCTPHWTTATGSLSSTVLTTLKMSGWMSSSASKMVTTSLWVWRKPTLSPCGLLMGLFLKAITFTFVTPMRRNCAIFCWALAIVPVSSTEQITTTSSRDKG